MKSHEYARKMQEDALFLLSKPEVEFAGSVPRQYLFYYTDKDNFLNAVRAFGSGEKQWSETELKFTPKGTNFVLTVYRTAVCRKVQDVKYECDPLLSDAEISEVGA